MDVVVDAVGLWGSSSEERHDAGKGVGVALNHGVGVDDTLGGEEGKGTTRLQGTCERLWYDKEGEPYEEVGMIRWVDHMRRLV